MSWFGFGGKKSGGSPSTSNGTVVTTNAPVEDEAAKMKRQLFTQYVEDIALAQRREVADRVDKIVTTERNGFRYFIGAEAFTLTVIYGYGMLYANRNFYRTVADRVRPLPSALFIGAIMYHLVFTLRTMAMRTKLSTLIADYEFHIKSNKCHHVEAGMTQLAWLQFVESYLQNMKEADLDTNKMRFSAIQ